MTDRVVTSFDDLHQIVQGYGKKTIIYRGVTRTDHELIPDVGRYDAFTPSDVKRVGFSLLRPRTSTAEAN